MTLTTTIHLNLPGTARAALEFYRTVFGGDLAVTTYREVGAPADSPDASRVVFGRLVSPTGFRVMAYDIPGRTEEFGASTRREHGATITDSPYFVSLRGSTLDEMDSYWSTLSDGATVIEAFAASEWSAGFGMLTVRFGVTWVVDVEAASSD